MSDKTQSDKLKAKIHASWQQNRKQNMETNLRSNFKCENANIYIEIHFKFKLKHWKQKADLSKWWYKFC